MKSNPSLEITHQSEHQSSIPPEEGLRLLRAFIKISNEQARLDVILFAEKQAENSISR